MTGEMTAEQWREHLGVTGWVHEDGTPCPVYLAPVENTPPSGWWCTTHQMYVRHPSENAAADPVLTALETIGARAKAATPGPWKLETDHCDCDENGCDHGSFPYSVTVPPGLRRTEVSEFAMADAEFIAASRTDIAALLRVAEAVMSLCRSTDGNWLNPGESLPVGEFQAALSLITEPAP